MERSRDGIRSTQWRAKHLNDMVKGLRRDHIIVANDFSGRFSRRRIRSCGSRRD